MILPFRALVGADHEDCEPSEECPDLAVQSFGGGDHEDCEPSEECPELAVQTVAVATIPRIVSLPRSVRI